MREIDFEEVFQNIKQNIMWEENLTEEDMDEEETEDWVNTKAKELFKRDWGFEYDDLESNN